MHYFGSLVLVLAACGGSNRATVGAPPTIGAAPKPAIALVTTPGTIAPGGSVSIAVTATNFKIVDPRSEPPVKDGEGHFHYYLDDAPDYIAGWTPSVTIATPATITAGTHTVRFVLATNAHEELTPLVEASTTFTVK